MITYRAIELDANSAQIGLIAALYALFPVILALQFGSWVGRLGEAKFVIYGTLAMMLTSDVLVVFLPLFGSENNFSPYAVGAILAIRAGTTMLSRLFLGRLSQRFSTFQLLWWSTIISIIACVAMAFAHTPIALGAIVFVAGFSLGVGQPLTMSLVAQKTESSERALAVSARLMGNRFGQFLVSAGAGAVAAASGAGAVFIGLAVLLASSIFSVKRN